MKYITIINVTVRSIVTVLIFLMIKKEEDYLILALLYSISQILIGISGLTLARIRFKVIFNLPGIEEVKSRLKSGWNIFQSMIAINIYTTSNVFILGLFASETVVGYYAAADKIRLAFQGIQSVVAQTAFPFVNKLLRESYCKFVLFIKRLLKIQPVIGFIISLALFVYSFDLANLLLGQQFGASGVLLRIISVIPFIISVSNVFSVQMMIPLGFDKAFNKIFVFTALLHILLLSFLIPRYFAVGTSIAVVITEFVVLLLALLFVIRNKLLFVNTNNN